jgi:hypothetical protein
MRARARRAALGAYGLGYRLARPALRQPASDPILFIAGMPKSGTTWLAQLLEEQPGYGKRPFLDTDRCTERHDVCDEVFESLRPFPGAVLKLHTEAEPHNLDVIRRHGVRTVVMFRDLRDQCVSNYFHVMADPTHRRHERYLGMSKADGLRDTAEITLTEYRDWITGWLPLPESEPERFHAVRYEDLRADPAQVVQRVLAFYDMQVTGAECEAIVESVAARTRFGLRASDLRRGKSTARKGKVGGWRDELPEDVSARFAREAGDLLAEMGYDPGSPGAAEPASRHSTKP